MKIEIIPILLLVIFSSCALDNSFLNPSTIMPAMNMISMDKGDTTYRMVVTGENFQPTINSKPVDPRLDQLAIKSVVFESKSGNKLNGWLIRQKAANPGITLLHYHGNAGILLTQMNSISPLIDEDIQVFMIDYSGFGYSTGEATRKNVLQDGISALEYVKAMPEVKGTQLVLYGQSIGGHLAAVVAAGARDVIDGLVMEGAFTSHKAIAGKKVPVLGSLFTQQQYSALRSIQQVNVPVLIIHSTEDKTIPFKMGEKLYDKANEPKYFYEIDGCHICGPRLYPENIREKIYLMLDQ